MHVSVFFNLGTISSQLFDNSASCFAYSKTSLYLGFNSLYKECDDGKYNLSYSTLVNAEYIKPLGELIEGGETCSVSITIIKKNDAFTYIPYLNCGDAYSTRELATQVIQDNPVTTEGNGLYQDTNGTYYFKGKIDNNYVALGTYDSRGEEVNYLWRIISIENNKVKLTIKRKDKEEVIDFKLVKVDDTYKTGLYVKDSISGIGTLTYIDPSTQIYGALGHEIIDKNTSLKMKIKNLH